MNIKDMQIGELYKTQYIEIYSKKTAAHNYFYLQYEEFSFIINKPLLLTDIIYKLPHEKIHATTCPKILNKILCELLFDNKIYYILPSLLKPFAH
jgi:hypothetical protein